MGCGKHRKCWSCSLVWWMTGLGNIGMVISLKTLRDKVGDVGNAGDS